MVLVRAAATEVPEGITDGIIDVFVDFDAATEAGKEELPDDTELPVDPFVDCETAAEGEEGSSLIKLLERFPDNDVFVDCEAATEAEDFDGIAFIDEVFTLETLETL